MVASSISWVMGFVSERHKNHIKAQKQYVVHMAYPSPNPVLFPRCIPDHLCFTFHFTSSWFLLRHRSSSFKDSTWASRSALLRVSSSKILRRPLVSASTSCLRDSSVSYLQKSQGQQQKDRTLYRTQGRLWNPGSVWSWMKPVES